MLASFNTLILFIGITLGLGVTGVALLGAFILIDGLRYKLTKTRRTA